MFPVVAVVDRFGLRIHQAGEYPEKLRDARDPVELLYFQGTWSSSKRDAWRSWAAASRATTDENARVASRVRSCRMTSRSFSSARQETISAE